MADISDSASFDALRAATMTRARAIAAADGATFVVRDGDRCFYVDEDAIAPLWRGQRFPLSQCISGWAMIHGAVAEVPDIWSDPRVPHEAYRPTFINSLVAVPMGTDDPPGAIGVYWCARQHRLDPDALAELSTLAEQAGAAVRRLGLDTAPWAPNFALRDER